MVYILVLLHSLWSWLRGEFHNTLNHSKAYELDVDPRRDDDASSVLSYMCVLRPTWMFMNRMIAPINVQSES